MPADAKLSLSTLRKIESGERKLDTAVLRELSARIGVPYAWFTVPDVAQAVLGSAGESVEDRLIALETAQASLAQGLRSLAGRREAVRHKPPAGDRGRSS